MYPLKVEDAILQVRKNLDEQNINFSAILPDEKELISGEDSDSENLDNLIAKTLPEAINFVHSSAPSFLIDGVVANADHLETESDGDVLEITLKDELLRLISFKAKESFVIITEADPEDSARARMQFNPYTRASFDRPCLVQLQNKASDLSTSFRYYGLKSSDDGLERMEYVPTYHYDPSKDQYNVGEMLVDRIINQLTGMCLVILGNTEVAQYFLKIASFEQN